MNKLRSLKHFMPLKLLIPILAISILAVVSFAANVTITTTDSQAVQGVIYNVNGGFTAATNGFQVTYSAATATSLPATWSNGGTVTTATVVGDWQYSLTLTITSSASASTTYTVTVQWNTGSGYATMGTALTVTTPSTITPDQTMTFVLSTGVSNFAAPVGIMITVA
jgi:alpha-D-ribose 1-methylphosphonate 5-phosphate C-P lyase